MVIPNKEVHYIYQEYFETYFMQVKQSKVPQLIKVLQEGNEEQVRIILNDILSKSISYYDNYETFYHGFLVGLFHQDNVKSNKESGEGRFDIALYGEDFHIPCVIIECKHSMELKQLKKDSEKAAKQINEKHYRQEMIECGYEKVVAYGIAFYKKRCYVTKG